MTTVNCCWNSDQNTTLPSHIGMNARTRLRSSPSTFGLVSMIAKIPIEISTTTIATAVERFAAVRMPVAKPTTTSTTTTTAPRAGRSQAPAGSGSGTTAALEGRPRRPEGVDREADGHADRREAERPVEADELLGEAREQRAEEGADVDAHVEDREPGVGARVVAGVERPDDGRRRRLHPAAAQRHQHEPDRDAGDAGQDRERDVPDHHRDRGDRTGCARRRAAGRPPTPRPRPRGTPARRRRR